jgi:hypothetical protein
MVSSAGGSSGQMSITRHGAWSTTNRVERPRLCGPVIIFLMVIKPGGIVSG